VPAFGVWLQRCERPAREARICAGPLRRVAPGRAGFRWAKHEAAVRGDRVRLTAACYQPGYYASGQNSGSEYDSHCLEGFLLDGVPGVIDCVFGGVAPLFHGFHR